MPEYTPEVIGAVFKRLAVEGERRGRMALEPLVLVIERQAKRNISYAPHKLRTPTPAVRGKGPGLISGNLRRALTHSPIRPSGTSGWSTKVGTAIGFVPPYGKTPANKYGAILEANGFPFLTPAYRFGVDIAAPAIYKEAYGEGWTRLDL